MTSKLKLHQSMKYTTIKPHPFSRTIFEQHENESLHTIKTVGNVEN